jgi:hypothetical protein
MREKGKLSIFNKRHQGLNQEFYTTTDTVEKLLPYLDVNKKYICPFDTHKSNIYKVLKQNGFSTKCLSDLRAKTFEELEKDYDWKNKIIITNPPFNSKKRYYSRMGKLVDKMFVILLDFTFLSYTKYKKHDYLMKNNVNYSWVDDFFIKKIVDVQKFIKPDGTITHSPHCVFAYFWRKQSKGDKKKIKQLYIKKQLM